MEEVNKEERDKRNRACLKILNDLWGIYEELGIDTKNTSLEEALAMAKTRLAFLKEERMPHHENIVKEIAEKMEIYCMAIKSHSISKTEGQILSNQINKLRVVIKDVTKDE